MLGVREQSAPTDSSTRSGWAEVVRHILKCRVAPFETLVAVDAVHQSSLALRSRRVGGTEADVGCAEPGSVGGLVIGLLL